MRFVVPEGLSWLGRSPDGAAWVGRLPRIVDECVERWSLKVGVPFSDAYTSLVLPATSEDGSAVVLKIQFPDRESEHEAAALAHWDGDGAIRLIEHDPVRHALLLERCDPGTPLSELDQDAALDVAV